MARHVLAEFLAKRDPGVGDYLELVEKPTYRDDRMRVGATTSADGTSSSGGMP